MSNDKNLWKRELNPQNFPDGLSIEDSVDILLRNLSISSRLEENRKTFPGIGIVRRIAKTNNLSLVNNNFAKDELVTTQQRNNLYIAFIEIENLTESYVDFKNNLIDKESFMGSLVPIYIDLSQANNRVPVKDEMIILNYEDPTNFTTAKFGGYPSPTPRIDTNLSNAEKSVVSSKQYFPQGA